jgi:hypothetical protein
MRNSGIRFLFVVAAALAISACAGGSRAARAPSGAPITLAVAFDRNPAAPNPDQINQVVDWMEPDLHRILTNAGYTVVPLPNAEAFQPGPERYLVLVHIMRYDAGSKAARMMVGWGAGALTLDTKNELWAGPGQLVFSSPGSVGSARDWNNAARKINEQIARDFTRALAR